MTSRSRPFFSGVSTAPHRKRFLRIRVIGAAPAATRSVRERTIAVCYDSFVANVDPIERESDERHRRIAGAIRRDPTVVDRARATLQRWIARDQPSPHPALLEWQAALATLTSAELADFLESTTPRARRLRSSSPFLDPA